MNNNFQFVNSVLKQDRLIFVFSLDF